MRAARSPRVRLFAGAGAVVAAMLALTACGSSEEPADAAQPAPSASASADASAPQSPAATDDQEGAAESDQTDGDASAAEDGATSGTGGSGGGAADAGDTDDAPAAGNDAPAAEGGAAPDTAEDTAEDTTVTPDGGGVDGLFTGTLSYLAPGELIISTSDGTDQAFYLAVDTQVWGAGRICGDGEAQAATACTVEELEAAVQSDAGIAAEVEMSDGIAVRVSEQR
ncbi:hypothetical protein [Allostreptomyces psammosilenae]|uniref:Uncharacterized protein n=1 Tax=Allostreptomyces psammosilenae TaxID=1892865 RepID=A0A853A2A9_9ACTN|nr:hypothetical protein [Allostreptomyces psammosilenae]NYI04652.1 hypothetical protein [Allostreptomyces psammosilenae]